MEKNQVSELLIRIGANPSYRGFPYLTPCYLAGSVGRQWAVS